MNILKLCDVCAEGKTFKIGDWYSASCNHACDFCGSRTLSGRWGFPLSDVYGDEKTTVLDQQRAHVAICKAFAMDKHFSDLGEYDSEAALNLHKGFAIASFFSSNEFESEHEAYDALMEYPTRAMDKLTAWCPFEGYDGETMAGIVKDCLESTQRTFSPHAEPYDARRISPAEFMLFLRSNAELYPMGDDETLKRLSVEDRVEVFKTILHGGDDLSADLLNDVLSDYDNPQGLIVVNRDEWNKSI